MPRPSRKLSQVEINQLKAHEDHVEQLIRDQIPHFLKMYQQRRKYGKKHQNLEDETTTEGNQSNAISDVPSQTFFDGRGRITESLIVEYEASISNLAYREIQKARGMNTSLAYCYKQVEFLLFCEKVYAVYPVASRFQVTGGKLLAFLLESVVERKLRKAGRTFIDKRNEELAVDMEGLENAIASTNKKLSYSTCNIYVSAIVDLWNYQRLLGSNANESPRTKTVSQILKWVRQRQSKNNRDNYVDRAATSLSNGYSTNMEVALIARNMYNNPQQDYKYCFRNATSFLLQHFLLLRGESIKNLEFADLQYMELHKMGVEGTYPAIIFIFNQGKTNKDGKTESGACIRNKMVEICPFMALSFHFFWRWHHDKEDFPNMESNKDWFQMKVIHGARPKSATVKKGKQPARENVNDDFDNEDDYSSEDVASFVGRSHWEIPISNATQTRFMREAFDRAGISIVGKITHAPRICATQMADNFGIPAAQISRMGKWSTDVMTNSYLNTVPRQFMRGIAGFDTDTEYHIPRGIEEPCQELKNLVFPMADYWYERVSTKNVPQHSVSAARFLMLVKCFKTTFLQDAAVMMDMIPDHPIWRHKIFKTQLFIDFKRKVNAHVDADEQPDSSIISKFAPEVKQQLQGIRNMISTMMAERGNQPLQMSVRFNDSGASASVENYTTHPSASCPPIPAVDTNNETSPLPSSAAIDTTSPNQQLQYTAGGVPIYTMSREITTVENLWKEWKEGWNGYWPVEELEKNWGNKWRAKDRKWFNIRKQIIDAVNDLHISHHIPIQDAINTLQSEINNNRWSLDKIGKLLQTKKYSTSDTLKRRRLA
ncbi:hypothetical protein [Parasitella parasitica]|uniref:Transcription activator GCR1-like domain-containing protein n=1 Tax=Parasitella parasitica TaxID=35722 RepID=A0A0B7MSB3_9FUNG|nr:hypothetical protein [Parasitella parasitica]